MSAEITINSSGGFNPLLARPPILQVAQLPQPIDRARIPAVIPPWYDRTPQILADQITIDGVSHRIKKLGDGKYHQVYEFLDDPTKILKVINRGPNGRCNVKNTPANQLISDVIELELADKYGIRTPKCFIRPDTYDTENKDYSPLFKKFNGGFFVNERIPHRVGITWSEKPMSEWEEIVFKPMSEWEEIEFKLMDFVGEILGLHIAEGFEIVSDFYVDNVMLSDEGEFVVVDMTHPEPTDDLVTAVWEKVQAWSAGNKEAEDYIMKDFSPGWQDTLTVSAKRQRTG